MRSFALFNSQLVVLSVDSPVTAAQPNIVWIIDDDMSPDTAAYGTEGVATPNLERLAREGSRFDRCFATAESFAASMRDLGNRCELKAYEGQPHGVFNPGRGNGPQRAEATRRYRDTMRQLDEFLDSLGYTQPAAAGISTE